MKRFNSICLTGRVQQCRAATRGSHLSHIIAPYWLFSEHLLNIHITLRQVQVMGMFYVCRFVHALYSLSKWLTETSLTHIYHDASSLLLVIISHAMAVLIQTAGKPFLSVWLYGAHCCGVTHPGNSHWWDSNTQCCTSLAQARGL